MNSPETQDSSGSIAIIGMSGRFPGARNTAEFWQNLRDGVESIQFFSDEEMIANGVDPAVMGRSDYVKAAGPIEGVDLFDAAFFGFTPREAEIMDPQQRLFLECAWEALEHAGYIGESYDGLIGVFAGSSISTYLLNNIIAHPEIIGLVGLYQVILSNDKDHLTTHVSYKLNLKGPSVNIQTACSTSLVAVSMACSSLLEHQCDMALAGGVSVKVPQKIGYTFQEGGIGSPDGHCRVFDARAKGTVSGNGVGIVVLKRLSDALAHGDSILAVIRGWSINNDGSAKVGYTAPGVDGQVEVIAVAQALSEVEPETISYIEAHGTGTSLGDPIEIAALSQVFRAGTDKKNFCAVGSVKSNIGHLDPAAGVAGLIKTVLALEHKMIPPTLNFKEPNPEIDFANSAFYVNDKLSSWERGETARRAAVSSFGIGGTNAHVILEEKPEVEAFASSRTEHLLCLSARTEASLENATANLLCHLKQYPNLDAADLAYTLHVGRKAFGHRRMLVYRDQDDAIKALETNDSARVLTAHQGSVRPVLFMFPGQGAQYVGMAGGLYETEPEFRAAFDRCSEQLKPLLDLDLRQTLYSSPGDQEEAAHQLKQTAVAQPALFVVEYALARLWMQWGISPRAMIGHSIGEYVAACLAGVFSLEDALSLVAARGRLMQQTADGAMLAVPLSEEEAGCRLNGKLSLAAVNGPALCVVSGEVEAVKLLEVQLAGEGVSSRLLQTSHAFHSQLMDPILDAFAARLRRVTMRPPQIPFGSNVTGTWVTESQATDPQYWTSHLRQTVRWAENLSRVRETPDCILLEVGPGQTLSNLARQQTGPAPLIFSSTRQPQQKASDQSFLLETVGRIWLSGNNIDWSKCYAHERRRRLNLPTYPFDRKPYWIEAGQVMTAAPQTQPTSASPTKPPATAGVSDWFYFPTWTPTGSLIHSAQITWPARRTTWLIFADDQGIGVALAAQLARMDHQVVLVQNGAGFERLSANVFSINPAESDDYSALLEELRDTDRLPEKIIHLWSVTGGRESGSEFYERCQDRGFYSLLFLAQALGQQTLPRPVQMVVVANGLHAVTGDEFLCPEKATLLGPCRVIPQEYSYIACRSIDFAFPVPVDRVTAESYLRGLIQEFAIESADPVVTYRRGQRLVQTYEPRRLEKESTPTRLRRGGAYLITGGLGGIGLALAEHLARTVGAKVALVGRTALPERAAWEQILATRPDGDPLVRKIRGVQAVESAGGKVLVFSADVADRQQMVEVVRKIYDEFGELHGVVHAAGIAGGGMIQLKSRQMPEGVFDPKVQGALVIRDVLKNTKLDFSLLCSSLSSIIGGVGQVDYCAANAFLDAFAYSESARGNPTISVNWPTWREVGMSVETDVPLGMQELRTKALAKGILSREGAEAFSCVMGSPLPQVAVVPPALLESLVTDAAAGEVMTASEIDRSSSADSTRRRAPVGSAYSAPGPGIENEIAALWQGLLGIELIGADDNFFELGGHSLLAVQIVSRLRETYSVELSLDHFFASPTVAKLAGAIEGLLIEKIAQLPDHEVQQLLIEES